MDTSERLDGRALCYIGIALLTWSSAYAAIAYALASFTPGEVAFARLQASWPLGHVSRVLGIERSELLRIPRKRSALIDLNTELQPQPLWKLFPQQIQVLREHTLYAQ